MNIIDPTLFNLSSRIQLKDLGENKIGIYKVIKSRIIRKDAEKIVSIASQMKGLHSELQISFICSRNICSKSLKLLSENEIEVIFQEVIS